MKACKYFLPCGYCDKYDTPCEATANGIIDYNVLIGEIDSETAQEIKACNNCEHEWRYGIQSAEGHHYICAKCGTMKVVPLESLSSTDKKCNHDWKIEQRIIFPPEDKNGKPHCVIKQVCRRCREVEFVKDDIYD